MQKQIYVVLVDIYKEKLTVFKKLFHYNDNTAHLDGTFFFLPGTDKEWFLQVVENLAAFKDTDT